MFDSIRKHQRILQFVLVLLIFPAFAFFGISGYDRFFSSSGAIATVDGASIPIASYERARREQVEQLQRISGGAIDPALLDTPAMRGRVIEQLVAQELLRAAASRARTVVSDEQLRDVIRSFPELLKPDGSFDLERYRSLLAAQGKSEALFEHELRADLIRRAIPDAVQSSSLVPAEVSGFLLAASEERRSVSERRFDPQSYVARVKVDDEQVRKYYEASAKSFEIPESVKAEYVVFGVDGLSRAITPAQSDVAAYYEQNKSRFGAPEERRASHILVAAAADASAQAKREARGRAEAILARVKGGEDFAAIARTESDDVPTRDSGGDLDFFTRDTMVKPFADAAFALAKGQTSDVVESEFGFHVIRLTDIRAAKTRPLAQVQDEILGELRRAMARQKFAEQAESFTNTVYEQADSLKPAAEKFRLEVVPVEEVTRNGVAGKADSPLNNRRLLGALFTDDALKGRRNTEAIEVGDNTLVSARVVEHRPARIPPLDEIRAQVESQLRAEQATKLAREDGIRELESLRSGGAASGFGADAEVSRQGGGAIAADALEAVFRLPASKVPAYAGVDHGGRGYSIYRVAKVIAPDPARIASAGEAFRRQLAGAYGVESAEAWLQGVRSKAEVKTFPERIPSSGAN